jgi:hypothetical protein
MARAHRNGRGLPAPEGASPAKCEFRIPLRRCRDISDGALHDPGAWSWLLDRLFAAQDAGLRFSPVRTGARGRKYRVTVPASTVGVFWEIVKEACVTFAQKQIPLTVHRWGGTRSQVLEVYHP